VTATRAIKSTEAMYQPMIVIGKAMENEILRAIFKSRARLAPSANTRDIPLIASSLYTVKLPGLVQHQVHQPRPYHLGSGMASPCASVPPSGIEILQLWTRAHMLKALAIGPNVPYGAVREFRWTSSSCATYSNKWKSRGREPPTTSRIGQPRAGYSLARQKIALPCSQIGLLIFCLFVLLLST